MSDVPLGKLIQGPAQRDAVHVAILPVTAAVLLSPGQRIKFEAGSTERVIAAAWGEGFGIVDPFIGGDIAPECRCYALLYPNTVTGMRHHWSHPGIPDEQVIELGGDSSDHDIIRSVAESCMVPVSTLMEAARKYAATGDSFFVGNNESYGDVGSHEWGRFWEAFKNVTGIDPANVGGHPFRCGC